MIGRGRSIEYDPAKDPAPDVYAVTWDGDEVTVVHFASIIARSPCCQVVGRISDADRLSEHGAEIGCLQRLKCPCEEKQ